MISYEAQVNQLPQNAYYTPSGSGSSKKKLLGLTLTGGLIGMNSYYLPVTKDVFVNRAFELTKEEAVNQINTLKRIAIEVEKNEVSTPSKMILQELGLSEDVTAIANKCIEIDKKVSDPAEVLALKDSFSSNFKIYKKDVSKMDNISAEAFKAIKQNKFRWGVGIGTGIGLALGLLSSRD